MSRREQVQLKAAKVAKVAELKKQREAKVSEPLNGFDVAETVDRENIKGAIEYFNSLSTDGTTINWTMADDTDMSVTLADLQSAADGYVLRKGQTFGEYQYFKSLVLNATTIAEVEAVAW